MPRLNPRPDALDELERVDRAIRDRLGEFHRTRPGPVPAGGDGGGGEGAGAGLVEAAALHGTVGKSLIEQLALREAALKAVTDSAAGRPELAGIVARLKEGGEERRAVLDRLEEVARGMQGIYLNSNVDFDAEMDKMAARLDVEVPRDLEVIPALLAGLGNRQGAMPSAAYLSRHSPLHPSPRRRWYQRFGPLVRIHALYDHYRGFPAGGSVPLSDVEQTTDPNHTRRG